MKLKSKRQLPPYYVGSLMVIFLIYFYTIGSYFSNVAIHWVHNKALGNVLSVVLYVGGLMILQMIFNRIYPEVAAKRAAQHITKAPILLKIFAFIFDLMLSLVISIIFVTYLFGHKSGASFSITGWAVSLLFLLVILYFFLMNKYAGGTFGQKVFGVGRQHFGQH